MTPTFSMNAIFTTALAFSILAGTIAMSPTPAQAQVARCAEHAKVQKLLGDKFKESRRAIGLISASKMVEVYVSDGGTWTIIYTRPDGISCVGAVGDNWQELEPEVPSGQS